MRKIYKSTEFEEFYNNLDERVQEKIKYILQIIMSKMVVNSKFVKKLVNTPYYELRISLDNEYRVILFTINELNFFKATEVYLLNGFMKKSTKDYKRELKIADKIIEKLSYDEKQE
ncbi:MAG: type II toxin-antitoxin system RelE/ParE family toxin [Bacteroidales bacterium]|nr:type II toxin-antitoxin system RelE/ParE family toxin [Bacteroidales bacterium]